MPLARRDQGRQRPASAKRRAMPRPARGRIGLKGDQRSGGVGRREGLDEAALVEQVAILADGVLAGRLDQQRGDRTRFGAPEAVEILEGARPPAVEVEGKGQRLERGG